VQTGLGGAITGEMGNGTNAKPDETFMIAALILFSNAAELFHHANRPAQIDFNLSSDVFEASSFVVNIDLTHDAGVVDQNVSSEIVGDLFVKSGDRFRIGNVASKGVNFGEAAFARSILA